MRHVAFAATVCAFILWGFSPAAAMPHGPHPFMGDEELRDLVSEAASLTLLHDLALTPEQRAQIKKVLAPVQDDRERMEKEGKEFREQHIKPRLRQMISDLKAGKAAAPAPEGDWTEVKTFRSKMATLRGNADQAYQKITALLTPEQQQKLQDFQFEEYLRPMHGGHPLRLLRTDPMKLIQQIRGSSQEELDQMIQEITRHEEARKSFRGGNDQTAREQKIQAFIELTKKIHAMPQSEFDQKSERLKQEMESLAPRRNGKEWGRHGGHWKEGFGPRRIILSEAFYEAL